VTNLYTSTDLVLDEIGGSTVPTIVSKVDAAVAAACRRIDKRTGRRFWQDTSVVTREFYADDSCELMSRVDQVLDISTTTGLIVKIDTADAGTFSTTLTIGTDFILLPPNAGDDSEPYTGIRLVGAYSFPQSSSGRPGVQITAKFGFAAVPDDIATAALNQAVYLYKGPDAAMGGLSFGEGSFMRMRGGLNPIAEDLVKHYAFPSVG
jgi:hypothetical protein